MSFVEINPQLDEEILYLTPYTPEETFDFSYAGIQSAALREKFYRSVHERDPGLEEFIDALQTFAKENGLDGGMLYQDVALFVGPLEALQKMHENFADRYTGGLMLYSKFVEMEKAQEERFEEEALLDYSEDDDGLKAPPPFIH